MNLMGKFSFQLLLLRIVKVRILYGVKNLVGNFRIFQVENFLAAVFVIQRNGRTILNCSLEVINRDRF